MSTVFSEEITAIPNKSFAIVQELESPMPKARQNALRDYVLRVMRENGLRLIDVQREARRRGGTLGTSSIQEITAGGTPNPGIITLQELAWGLAKPVDELIAAALGTVAETAAFKRSDFANIADLYQQLPNGEQRYFKRLAQMVEREMRRAITQLADHEK